MPVDRWFTIPGVIVITVSGFLAAIQAGLPLLRTGWIFWSIIAFSVSGIVFGWRVAPLQKQIFALTSSASDGEFPWDRYRSMSQQWEIWGFVATVTPDHRRGVDGAETSGLRGRSPGSPRLSASVYHLSVTMRDCVRFILAFGEEETP